MQRYSITCFLSFVFLLLTFNASATNLSSNRMDIITQELDRFTNELNNQSPLDKINKPAYKAPDLNALLNPQKTKTENKDKYIQIKGSMRLAVGVKSDEIIWNRANYDLYEKNWRTISSDALNNRINTYDPGIYDRLKVIIDGAKPDNPLSFHTNITIDPWSYVGKSDRINIRSTTWGNDSAEIQLLSWGNTSYTVNQKYFTQQLGDSFNLPEIKIHNNTVDAQYIYTAWSKPGNVEKLYLPETKIHTTFQPVRELWFDYKPNPEFKFRFFPLALEDQVKTSDDPLQLSGHRIYWENSAWLNSWQPVNFNSFNSSFNSGRWDNSLAFLTRDSDATHLTGLRGFSFESKPVENTTFTGMVATPKTLWQGYDEFSAVPMSFRAKSFLTDNFYIGDIANAHLGFTDRREIDAYNAVNGLDMGYALNENLKFNSEVSYSKSLYNKTYSDFIERKRGNAYYAGATYSSLSQPDILNTDYYGMRPDEATRQTTNYRMAKIYGARMDQNFESSLSNYRNTRRDAFWSRHLHFQKNSSDFFASGDSTQTIYDIEPFAIGDGIDYGRKVAGIKGEINITEIKSRAMADIRNVHRSNGKYVENVSRLEIESTPTTKLTTKLLYINHDLPKTKAGIDPFIYDSQTGEYLLNNAIREGMNPSLNTASAGAQYAFIEQIKANMVWEYTNDFTASTDNFPRGIFNDSYTVVSGFLPTKTVPFLYNQGLFDMPPFTYHHIFRTGLEFTPSKKWDIYLDYARNPNKFAGPVDGNMNHVGLEINFLPTEKLGFMFKYTYSKWYNLQDLNQNVLNYTGHNNFFGEIKYLVAKDSNFILQYGVGPSQELKTITYDPYGGTMPILDTEHIIRMFFNKKF
ncbi:MAG: hypothetical protein HQL25_08085 [Candidatus Omnitrophica bacterium]|nr:hypothetical protein [Candidatus Omnitrophota bacterium]